MTAPATPTPRLDISPTPPVLAFNFEQLKAWANEIAERYQGFIVTEDAIAETKRDMAEINKTRKTLDEARKETVKKVSEPIRAFEAKVKEVCDIFDSAYAALGRQVKHFEDAQRQEKRQLVEVIIQDEIKDAYQGREGAPVIPVEEGWLNKTTTFKAVKEAVRLILAQRLKDDQLKREREQAERNRAIAIENVVKTHAEAHGFSLPVADFLSGRFAALNLPEALEQIQAAFAREKAWRDERNQAPAPIQAAAPVSRPEPAAETITMSIVLAYSLENEAKVQDCLKRLKSLCLSYGARTR